MYFVLCLRVSVYFFSSIDMNPYFVSRQSQGHFGIFTNTMLSATAAVLKRCLHCYCRMACYIDIQILFCQWYVASV